MEPMRVGIVDVGANTLRLLVASPDGGRIAKVAEERRQLGLGKDVERYGYVSAPRVAAASDTARELVRRARKLGCERVEIAVTSPGRQSANGEEFVYELRRAAGAPARILSAEEEAILAWHGAVSALEHVPETVAVCDVEGGSTQIAVGSRAGGPAWSRSIDLGSLRLTHRLLVAGSGPGAEGIDAARREVAGAFCAVTPPLPRIALATGGTARALRRVAASEALGAEALERAIELLGAVPSKRVAKRFRLDRARAHTLLAGTIILAEVQRRLGLPLEQAVGGVREGMALELLSESASALA
jgi:exopolyphosphatase/guanosine-5'-triphosphate,3'-diphosphate pyrophosphatase